MNSTKFKLTVSSIISSRVQYVKFQQQKLIETVDNNSKIQGHPSFQITDDLSAASANEFIEKFKQFSRAKRLLKLMWNHLSGGNAKFIFKLLSNNKYLEYSEEELVRLLNLYSKKSFLKIITKNTI